MRSFVAGNWKMNLKRDSAIQLAQAIAAAVGPTSDLDIAVCPPSCYLEAVGAAVQGSAVALGAQNMYHQPSGAFTGELSAEMLKDLSCQYVILGHSERRHILGETDALVNKKVLAALDAQLEPIVCVGETLQQREADQTHAVVQEQLEQSLAGLAAEQMARVVIAYEPVWAIGTGKVATPEQAEQVHADLRSLLQSRYNAEVAAQVRIQYGGSVKPDNAGELLRQTNIDGWRGWSALLDVDSFLGIIRSA